MAKTKKTIPIIEKPPVRFGLSTYGTRVWGTNLDPEDITRVNLIHENIKELTASGLKLKEAWIFCYTQMFGRPPTAHQSKPLWLV